MVSFYPISVRLKNKRAIIIGGGPVAQRKVISLMDAGARITVVSPQVTERIALLAKKDRIKWFKHLVRQNDLRGADIVIAATSDIGINKKVSVWARKTGALVNVVDNSKLSDFISPAVLKKQKAIIAVYTDGREPELSRDLKDFLKEHWDEFLSYRDRS